MNSVEEVWSPVLVLAKPSRRGWLLAGVLLVSLLGAGFTIRQVGQTRIARQESEQAQKAHEATILPTVTALGRLEPEGETISLTAPTSAQESRIEELLVNEGDPVEAGQVIAILDNRDLLQAALQSAEERVRIARSQLAQVKAGAKTSEFQAQRAEIARLEAELVGNLQAQRATAARLEAEMQNARIEADRYESLYQQGAVSASQRDTTQLTYITAQRQLQETQAQISRIERTSQQQIQQAQASLVQLSEVRPVDIAVAEAEVQSAIATVAEAKANLEQAYVRAPIPGQVMKIHTQPGETIADEGIITLGQTQQMMVIADVYQSDIAQVQTGQSVEVTSSLNADPLQGIVERIGLQVERQQVVNEDPAVNIDANVVEVHIRLDEPSSQQVAALTNLQVTAKIAVE